MGSKIRNYTYLWPFTCIPFINTQNRGKLAYNRDFWSEMYHFFKAFFLKNFTSKVTMIFLRQNEAAAKSTKKLPQHMFDKNFHVIFTKCQNIPGPKKENM